MNCFLCCWNLLRQCVCGAVQQPGWHGFTVFAPAQGIEDVLGLDSRRDVQPMYGITCIRAKRTIGSTLVRQTPNFIPELAFRLQGDYAETKLLIAIKGLRPFDVTASVRHVLCVSNNHLQR